jgi:hypothetical protein
MVREDSAVTEYEWPRITVVHPEFGAYQIDVHCLKSPGGALVLVAFHGARSNEQVPIVRQLAEATGDTVEALSEEDISTDMGIRLAAHFHANPDAKVGVLQVERR